MSAGVPATAITAATDAIHFYADAVTGERSCLCLPAHPTARYDQDRERVIRALEAAAPAIAAQAAAAERERIRELAISVNAIVFRAVPAKLTGGTPTFETSPFADLLEAS